MEVEKKGFKSNEKGTYQLKLIKDGADDHSFEIKKMKIAKGSRITHDGS